MVKSNEWNQEQKFEYIAHRFGAQTEAPDYGSVGYRDRHDRAIQLLSYMTERQREAMTLRMEMLSYRQIAELLGITHKSVEELIHRGLARATQYLEDREWLQTTDWEVHHMVWERMQQPKPKPSRINWDDWEYVKYQAPARSEMQPRPLGKPSGYRYRGEERRELMMKALEYKTLGLSDGRIGWLLNISKNTARELLIEAAHNGIKLSSPGSLDERKDDTD